MTPCQCGSRKLTDITGGLGAERNYYCPDCRRHYYLGRWWTKAEWAGYVEI